MTSQIVASSKLFMSRSVFTLAVDDKLFCIISLCNIPEQSFGANLYALSDSISH